MPGGPSSPPDSSLPESAFLQDTGRVRSPSRSIFQLGGLSSQPGEVLPWSPQPQAISLQELRPSGVPWGISGSLWGNRNTHQILLPVSH